MSLRRNMNFLPFNNIYSTEVNQWFVQRSETKERSHLISSNFFQCTVSCFFLHFPRTSYHFYGKYFFLSMAWANIWILYIWWWLNRPGSLCHYVNKIWRNFIFLLSSNGSLSLIDWVLMSLPYFRLFSVFLSLYPFLKILKQIFKTCRSYEIHNCTYRLIFNN